MASIKKTVEVEGLSDLLDNLEDLKQSTQVNVQKRALTKAAEPIAKTAQSLAPVGTGKLERSITIGTRLSGSQKEGFEKESAVEIYIGPAPLVQAITSEFGTFRQSPRPFMRPAWDENKEEALTLIVSELWSEILKAADRAARKQARLLAKQTGG